MLGGWQALQWNFSPASGVNAPAAWDRLNAVGRPGGAGVKVAVLDTGVAYARHGGFRRSPDLLNHFLRGFDFVDGDSYARRPQRPRHPRREHDRRDDRQRHRRHRARLRRAADAGARARPRRHRRLGRDQRRPALRRPQGRQGDQPLVRVRLERHPRPDPRHPRRAALRPPQGRARDRRLGQLLRPRGRLPGARQRRDVGRRDHGAPVPGGLLQLRQQASTSPPPAAASTPTSPATRTAAPAPTRSAATSTR